MLLMHNAIFIYRRHRRFIFFSLKDIGEKMRDGNILFNRVDVFVVGHHHVGSFLGNCRRL